MVVKGWKVLGRYEGSERMKRCYVIHFCPKCHAEVYEEGNAYWCEECQYLIPWADLVNEEREK